jgi:glycosyltransferase involved in cell wall biosynthesis
MKIGMVVEGSYPYVSGGVASWVQMLVKQMPEHEFVIIAITPEPISPEDYRYELPGNISQVLNLPLNMQQPRRQRNFSLTPADEEAITEWMKFESVRSDALLALGQKLGGTENFFSSGLFWEIVQQSYDKERQSGSFIDYFWMWRGMFAPVIELLQFSFPDLDIVHSASTGYAGMVAAAIKKQQEIPYLLTEHGIYSREREEEILQADWIPDYYKQRWITFFHHLSRQAYKEADDVITLFARNGELQEEIGADPAKIEIIPNGIDYSRLSLVEKDKHHRSYVHIGAIVRVVPIKDIKTMIHAGNILKSRSVPFKLTIMGPLDEDLEYAGECRRLVDQLGLQDHVFLVGKVNITDYLPTFDVCLLTSISEGQPLAVLEGMAAGLPFIATNVGSCSELIHGREGDPYGPAGFVVPPVNPEQVAQRCEWIYQHPEEAEKFGRNGQNRVEAYYQIHQFIQEYTERYHQRGLEYGRHRV